MYKFTTPLNTVTNSYNYIQQLIKSNRNDNTVYINFDLLDETTKSEIRKVIPVTIQKCKTTTEYSISEDTDEILKKLQKSANLSEIKIEYDKIDEYQVRFSLKGAIQQVLDTRSTALYHNMVSRTF